MANILKIIPLVQSAKLLEDNVGFSKKKKKDAGDFVKQGTKNIVGIGMIGLTEEVIDSL